MCRNDVLFCCWCCCVVPKKRRKPNNNGGNRINETESIIIDCVCYTLFSFLYIYFFHLTEIRVHFPLIFIYIEILYGVERIALKTVYNKSIKWFPGVRNLQNQQNIPVTSIYHWGCMYVCVCAKCERVGFVDVWYMCHILMSLHVYNSIIWIHRVKGASDK